MISWPTAFESTHDHDIALVLAHAIRTPIIIHESAVTPAVLISRGADVVRDTTAPITGGIKKVMTHPDMKKAYSLTFPMRR